MQEFAYTFVDPRVGDDAAPLDGRIAGGRSVDGKGTFRVEAAAPLGTEPTLAPPKPGLGAQAEQMTAPTGMLGAITHAITGEA